MSEPSVAIVGAGLGGLSAGCYGQINGLETRVFEAHALPGGVCTAWKRKGYTFDGCIHHLPGCQAQSGLYRLWEDLGALPRPVLFPADLVRVEDAGGKGLTIFTDLERLEEEMKRAAPGDGRAIDAYLRGVRVFTRFELFDVLVDPARLLAKALPRLPRLAGWGKLSMAEAAKAFRDPFLRRAIPTLMYDRPETPLLIHLNMLGGCAAHRTGWPAGGSLEFARSIEKRYQELGGEIHYASRVAKVLTEKGRAIGVRLADGTEHRADFVVSNAYAHATVFDLLDGRYVDDAWRAAFAEPEDRMVMGLHVSIGAARDLSGEAHAIVLWLPEAVTIAGEPRERLDLELFGFDPSLAPAGKGVLKLVLDTSYAYWKDLSPDPALYKSEKAQIAEAVVGALTGRFPGLEAEVETVDVATPMTTERYTGGGRTFKAASAAAWMFDALRARPKTVPGLQGFYLVGQWVGGAGLAGCAVMGKNAIRAICRATRRPFRTL